MNSTHCSVHATTTGAAIGVGVKVEVVPSPTFKLVLPVPVAAITSLVGLSPIIPVRAAKAELIRLFDPLAASSPPVRDGKVDRG